MPDFWSDQKKAEQQMRKIKTLKMWIEKCEEVEAAVGEVEVGFDFVKEGLLTEDELDAIYADALDKVEKLELRNMLRAGSRASLPSSARSFTNAWRRRQVPTAASDRS